MLVRVKGTSRKCHERFKGDSSIIKGDFKFVSKVFKIVLRMFQGNLKGLLMVFLVGLK